MATNPILEEVKKATDLWMDKTYNESEFYSHILQIIRDATVLEAGHKEQLERLIFKVEELRENQRLFHGGMKTRLTPCKLGEADMDKKIHFLKTVKGYNVDRFKIAKPVQKPMF